MTQFLPPNLLALFAPRDPVPYMPPAAKLPHEKDTKGYQGVSQFMLDFEDPKETPAATTGETKEEKKDRIRREKTEQVAYKLEQELALWDPHSNPGITEDAFKSLFVSRISFDTSESKLRREFEVYGPIKSIKMIHDVNTGKPRGYAFLEYEHERDMHSAYKHADGKKIDGRRVLVDVERARTVKGWKPRRLGGGLGSTRKGKTEENNVFGGREGETTERPERAEKPERRRRSKSRDREERKRSRSRERSRRGGAGEDREERKRSRSRERPKRSRRSRSRDRDERKRRSRSRDKKRSRRSRSRDRRRDRDDVRVKQEKTDDGYQEYDNGDANQGAPKLPEGQSEELQQYPPPQTEETEENGYQYQ